MRERFLAIHVLAQPHSRDGRCRVRVVGRRNHDGVNPRVELVEQLAEIVVFLGFLELCGRRVQPCLIDVADGDNPAVVPSLFGVSLALAADADARNIQGLIRSYSAGPASSAPGKDAEAPTDAPNKNDRRSVIMLMSMAPGNDLEDFRPQRR